MGLTRNEYMLNTKGTTDRSWGRSNWMEVVKRYKVPIISKYLWVALVVENLPANVGDISDAGSITRSWQSTPVFLPGAFHGQRNLVGYSPQGHSESDTTEAT